MENVLKAFIKNSVSSFVKEQTQKAGWTPDVCVHGYCVKDLIEYGHLIPICDLMRVLNLIDENATMCWCMQLQLDSYKIRNHRTLH